MKTIFPVTRVHEPMRADLDISDGQVTNAWISDMLFRGFEAMLRGRDPRDAALFTQRICGICSSAHAIAASMAEQQAFGVKPTVTGQHLTNLIFAADILQNHLRHFYLLVVFDYVQGPSMPPYVPRPGGDYRLPPNIGSLVLEHVKQGIEMSARAHEMMAIFGAKAPHQQTILPTGVTETVTAMQLTAYRSILKEIMKFAETVYVSDVETIGEFYPDYYQLGAGYGNFFSYGMFPDPVTGTRAMQAGIIIDKGEAEALDTQSISEEIRYSWYKNEGNDHDSQATPAPDRDKPDAYTWVKAPRYQGNPLECGPLARGWVNGDYRRGVSVIDRLMARALEVVKICRLAEQWLDAITPGSPTHAPYMVQSEGSGAGLTDAMRGALGHWLTVREGRVANYQIITPTAWNFSPRGEDGRRGPAEEALIGTPIADPENPVEAGRVIRSFDPCFTCAVHAIYLMPKPL